MSFFAILIALLLEQARPLAHDNPVHVALRGWARWVRHNLDTGQSAHAGLAWALAVALPALVAALVYWAIGAFSLLLSFVWLVLVLYLTLGFRQFSHHFTAVRQSMEQGDDLRAREHLTHWQRAPAGELSRPELLKRVVEHALLAAHRHVLGVLVAFLVGWVLGLGPAGAVLYRMAEYVSRVWTRDPSLVGATPCSPGLRATALKGWSWVDALPARVTALAFAVVGNFEEAVASWRGEAERHASGSDGIVLAAGAGALNVRLGGADAVAEALESEGLGRPAPQLAHLGSVVGLVWRSVVLWMLMLALLSLARLPV